MRTNTIGSATKIIDLYAGDHAGSH
jgi:hypothetical protein